MLRLTTAVPFLGLLFLSHSAQAQPPRSVDWSKLPDPATQQFEDPYRDLSRPQFESLMSLAQLQIILSGEKDESERADLETHAREISKDLQAQGLDPQWILAQRDVVAERRQRAATSTNPDVDGEFVEIAGYLLVAKDVEDGVTVAFLLPGRGVCMHLPPPVPNQLIRLDIDEFPEPLAPCISASVRGRLLADENDATVPIFEDTAFLWSSWRLEVAEASTAGALSPDDNKQ